MPIFYHVHVKYEPDLDDTLEKGFTNEFPLFMSKKNSWWYEMKINDGKPKDGYKGGYYIYQITIPKELFTTSLHPTKNKILKITKNNIDEYIKYLDLHCDGTFQSELAKRNIIGVDATNKIVTKYKYRKHKLISPPEARIWKKLPQIKIKKCDIN